MGVKTKLDLEIRELAYKKWEEAGRPCSDGVSFWVEAEGELKGGGASKKVDGGSNKVAAKTSTKSRR
jgi:hypothetical protein